MTTEIDETQAQDVLKGITIPVRPSTLLSIQEEIRQVNKKGSTSLYTFSPATPLLEGEIEAQSLVVDEQQQVAIVRFSRSEVQGILGPGEVLLRVPPLPEGSGAAGLV